MACAFPSTSPCSTSTPPTGLTSARSRSARAARSALIIQDMQNDVIIGGGACADSGALARARHQNAVENVARRADACRSAGMPVIHVWYIVEQGASGLRQNAPLFRGVKDANAL